MKPKFCESQLFLRGFMLVASFAALVLGAWGVSSSRDIGARYASIQIPLSWYWFAVLPPLVIATLAVLLPQRIIC